MQTLKVIIIKQIMQSYILVFKEIFMIVHIDHNRAKYITLTKLEQIPVISLDSSLNMFFYKLPSLTPSPPPHKNSSLNIQSKQNWPGLENNNQFAVVTILDNTENHSFKHGHISLD